MGSLLAGWLVAAAAPAAAEPLNRLIPGLFAGTLTTTTQPGFPTPSQPLLFADQFRSLSAGLAAARSQAPIPSATGAFRFAWDPDLDTFVRLRQSLGPGLAERAQTLGQHTYTVSVSYTHIDFDTQEGNPLDNLTFSQPAFTPQSLAPLPPFDQMRFGGDRLRTHLDLGLSFDLLFFAAAIGITDSVDASVALSVNHAHMRGTAVTRLEKDNGSPAAGAILINRVAFPKGQLCDKVNQCVTDSFDESAFGTGDLFLRSKWHFYDASLLQLAVAGVLTLPTGNADDFLGFHDPTFTPWLIASNNFGAFSPHLNLGYALRSGADVSQAQWILGTDVRAAAWLTLAADFLGFHDDKRDGINDDVIQSALGFKVNPFGQFVIGGTFQFPLNSDGIRANVIYTGQIEYTF